LDFWSGIFSEIDGNSILELACGTGRLAYSLIRDGADFTGIELSSDFVTLANKKLKNVRNAPTIINGNMCNFNINKKFDMIFIGFNSFLHLLSDDDAIACLNCVKRHMHKNTRFLIDAFVPNPLFLYRPEGMRFFVLEYTDCITGNRVAVEESNEYNVDTEVNHLTWYFSDDNNIDFNKETFSMRMYFPSKMNQLIVDAGFKVLHQWGDYYRTPLGEGSNLQIYDMKLR
jgi:SAM-dependent methyltransferase